MDAELHQAVARAIADAIDAPRASVLGPSRREQEAAAAAIRVYDAAARRAVEAIRYESRYMIGGDAEMGESSDWLRRDAALAVLAKLAEDTP